VSIQPAAEQVSNDPPPVEAVVEAIVEAPEVALEFVRFCYRRRHVAWPALYDEMSAVASRSLFRGMGYGELAEHGVSFCLADLRLLVDLTERVVREETPTAEPLPGMATLSLAPATN
jgi:hypothetical protein